MNRIIIALVLAFVGFFVAATPAQAGSDNGTNNWYSSDSCSASGGNLVVTNYDRTVNGDVWQRYHIDADRAGGTGAVPVVSWRVSGNSTWNGFAGYWNDFYWDMPNQWTFHDFRVRFANGSTCYIWAL